MESSLSRKVLKAAWSIQ